LCPRDAEDRARRREHLIDKLGRNIGRMLEEESISSFGPAMNPSSDIVVCTETLAIRHLRRR
jgi:hypothetical protein